MAKATRQPDRGRSVRVQHAAASPLGRVTMAGRLDKHDAAEWRGMRRFGQYAAVYLFAGAGRYVDELGRDLAVSAGDLILVFPEVGHRYGPTAGGAWREVYLAFDGPVFDLWRARGLLSPDRPVLRLEPIDHWLRRFESVLGAPWSVGWSPPLLEVTRLQQVLGEALVGGERGQLRQDEQRWAAQACALLEADLEKPTDLAAVASEMKMSYACFRRRFSERVGMPPGRYRATRQVDRACELIQRSDMCDKQIAAALGFCDAFHFSRRFKQITGKSPRAFRRALP